MYLESIKSPTDLKKLSLDEQKKLAGEIRQRILSTVSRTGGHLASNLGTVELTLALHSVFDCPQDKIVWDVGHQAYTHKIITGRNAQFDTLRQENGLSGFPKQKESPYDAYLGGHSGVSISAALGMAEAMRLHGEEGFAIAVIGDGSFGSGIAYEGMNNAGRSGEKIIIVINDNDMSISRNVGNVANYLAKMRSSRQYFQFKDNAKSFLNGIPMIGKPIRSALASSKKVLRQMMYHSNLFEDFGLRYFGPVNGHDLESLRDVFERAKHYGRPCVVHVHTTKGMGYRPAMENPSKYHGVGPFDLKRGLPLKASDPGFSGVFGKAVCDLAQTRPQLAVITAAMTDGTGLEEFARRYTAAGRFFDVGIAEEHAVSFACGMSTQGTVPVFAVYSTFLQRTCDQLIHDAAIEPKHLVLAIDRAGLVGADGETHQGVFDVSMLRMIPDTVIYSPATYRQLEADLAEAVDTESGICAVRYPKGSQPALASAVLRENTDSWFLESRKGSVLLATYGRLTEELLLAQQALRNQGCDVDVLVLNRIYPLPTAALEQMKSYQKIFFYEEGIRSGSIGELCALQLMEQGYRGDFRLSAIEDRFIPQCGVEHGYQLFHADHASIIKTVLGEKLH